MTATTEAKTRAAVRSFLGDPAARTLLPMQALHSAGESLFALSLVGSLFFNVSVDAARPRILLYLALTMAPFAVLAPLIGPFIDRISGGHRAVLVVSLGARAAVAALLASQLKTLLLYPEAFVIVVFAKVYVVARNALIPSLVESRDHLVVVNSRLARVGTMAGLSSGLLGVAVLSFSSAAWVLRLGAVVYGLGALAALRIPAHRVKPNTSPIVESTEMHGPGVRTATIAMAGLRMATGFVFFHIGFALKTSGQPAWVIGGIAGTAALAGFSGTFVAPRLHRRWDEQRMLTASLILPAIVAVFTALRFHGVTAVALAASLGLAGSVGRRAFDGVVQTQAPHARRGRAYAGLETRLEVAWVIGAVSAVLLRAPNWLGMVILAVGLTALSLERIARFYSARRVGAEVGSATLALRLMETAEAVAAKGDRQQAVLVALAAVEAAAAVGDVCDERLGELRRWSRIAALENDTAVEDNLLRVAHDLVSESTR